MAYNKTIATGLSQQIKAAQDAMKTYLASHFPIGAPCQVILMSGQINPTPATITGVRANTYGGSVTVKIHTAKTRTRQLHRDIPAENVTLSDTAS